MKPGTTTAAAVGLLTLALATPALAQEKLYVASEGAALKADKAASSATVAALPLGAPLTVLGQEGSWYKVSAQNATGWIYRGKVASAPPEPSKQGGDNLFGSVASSGIVVAESDTARSMRGLAEEKDAAGAAGRPTRPLSDYKKALGQVLAEKIGRKELESFLKAGKIGEYAN